MVKNLLICVLLISLFGCGQDNDTSSTVTPPSQQLKGTYKLVSASGTYLTQNGTFSLDGANSITGTLVLGDVSYDETLVVDGVTYSRSNGSYSMITFPNGAVEGSMTILFPNGAGQYGVTFNDFNLDLTGGHNSKWQKVSD